MTIADRQYQKKIQEVNTVAAETACVASIQAILDFANQFGLGNFKLQLTMEPKEN